MTVQTIALFPLHTVLFPNGPLALRIFEPRYLDMVSDCMRNDTGFGVCLIKEGAETGKAAATVEIGTLGKITDWQQDDDGLLGITVTGQQRFRVTDIRVEKNQLAVADVQLLDTENDCQLPEGYQSAATLLSSILDQVGGEYTLMPRQLDDASWVSYRLSELLPIDNLEKQTLLETDDPIDRLDYLNSAIENLSPTS